MDRLAAVARNLYAVVSAVLIGLSAWALYTAATMAPGPNAAELDPNLTAFNTGRLLLVGVSAALFIPGWLGLGAALRR